jgi:hypothetical protein
MQTMQSYQKRENVSHAKICGDARRRSFLMRPYLDSKFKIPKKL